MPNNSKPSTQAKPKRRVKATPKTPPEAAPKTPPQSASEPLEAVLVDPLPPVPSDATQAPASVMKSATCALCGSSRSHADWEPLASWFATHLQAQHPEEFRTLFATCTVFLTWMISQCFETDPDWNEEEAMTVMQQELVEILDGTRDPLVDGLS